MEELGIFAILTLEGLAFSDQPSAFNRPRLAKHSLPTAYRPPAASLVSDKGKAISRVASAEPGL
jgi:hypothetical protein